MELLIRSQDRLKLKIYNNCLEIFHETQEFYPDRYIIYENDIELGKYKTKERALEVLDEIQEKITQFNVKTDYGCVSNIYEMPNE